MKYIFIFLFLSSIIMFTLLFIITRKHFKLNYIILFGIIILYFIASLIAVLGILNDFNLICLDTEILNSLDELDVTVEIPDVEETFLVDSSNNNHKSLFIKFLNLFIKSNDITYNHYNYTNYNFNFINSINRTSSDCVNNNRVIEKCSFISAQYKIILFYIECFTSTIADLEAIQKNLV